MPSPFTVMVSHMLVLCYENFVLYVFYILSTIPEMYIPCIKVYRTADILIPGVKGIV